MRAIPSSPDRVSIFFLHFPRDINEYRSLDLIKGFFDSATLDDDYCHELDLLAVM